MTPRSDDFPTALRRWRNHRGYTIKALAARMGFDRSHISHIEAGRHHAGADFARTADTAFDTGGDLLHTWRSGISAPHPESPDELYVDTDHATLTYTEGHYTARMRRRIVNGGTEPVTRYLIRISVDRYPGHPERSNQLYRTTPLTWETLCLTATCNGEPMRWVAKHDRDSFKEVWLCFDNDTARFPLYPGQAALLDYPGSGVQGHQPALELSHLTDPDGPGLAPEEWRRPLDLSGSTPAMPPDLWRDTA